MDGTTQGDGVPKPNFVEDRNDFQADGKQWLDQVGFQQWAVVDVMGHQRYIGHVTEQVIAGKGFVRVDIPSVGDQPAFTKLIGTGSIYSISPVSEQVARAMCEQRRQTPIESYDLPRLSAGTMHNVDNEADYDVEEPI